MCLGITSNAIFIELSRIMVDEHAHHAQFDKLNTMSMIISRSVS
jgi:hypothetical protein